MERLTEKLKKPISNLKYCVATNPSDAVSITQKLGRLEDLEEQIGMPLEEYFDLLQKENVELKAIVDFEKSELKQQLKAKDKALDKACGKLEYDTMKECNCPRMQYRFTPKCCGEDFCDGSNKEC